MASNGDSILNATTDVLSTIFVAVIVVGLFKCFEKDKLKNVSFINIFDDCLIFLSAIIYPIISGIQCILYHMAGNDHEKKRIISMLPLTIMKLYVFVVMISIGGLSIYQYQLIIYGDIDKGDISYVSGFCSQHFGIERCTNVKAIVNYVSLI
ncbi:22411_t:CDS:2, partial [Dentiscutata erythropus]